MRIWISAFCAIVIIGCGSEQEQNGAGQEFAVAGVLAEVEPRELKDQLFLVGTLTANERVDITAEIDGTVVEVAVDEGQAVAESDVLFRLDDSKLKAELEAAQAEFTLVDLNFERGKRLLADKTINQQDYDQFRARYLAQKARVARVQEDLDDALISAPFAGRLGARRISMGQYVTRGEVLAELVEVDILKVECHVPERYLARLESGMPVSFRSVAFPDETFSGKVYFVSPQVDAVNRTVLIKARIDNSDGRLKPGMFGNLDLTIETFPGALTIPEAAVTYDRDGAKVFVVGDDDRASVQRIDVGLRLPGRLQVLSGLSVGQRVVVEGHQKMQPGVKVAASEDNPYEQ